MSCPRDCAALLTILVTAALLAPWAILAHRSEVSRPEGMAGVLVVRLHWFPETQYEYFVSLSVVTKLPEVGCPLGFPVAAIMGRLLASVGRRYSKEPPMTSSRDGRVRGLLLVVASMGAAACSNSDSARQVSSGNAGGAGGTHGTAASNGTAGVGGSHSGGTTGGSGGAGGGAGGVSGSGGSGGRGGAAGSSGGTSGSGGSASGGSGSGGLAGRTSGSGGLAGRTSGSGGSAGGISGSGGTLSVGGSSAADAGAPAPDGAAGRDGRGREAAAGRAGADTSAGTDSPGSFQSSSTGSDGCGDSQATNLTLLQIAVYQSVKIPLMTNGTEVATGSRNSNVVEGRDTMFRVFVTLGSGWTARELSARLTLTPSGGEGTQYYAKQTLTASSTDDKLASTFQILVPASDMTASLSYSVEIVECGAQPPTGGTARFPATGDADLGVKTTGGLKVTIIPMQVGTLLPDTSEAALAVYASQMKAMYPIDAISFTVGDTLTVTSPVDWNTMLDQVQAKRTKDAPSADTYYFGLVKPASSMRTYCQSVCTAGISFVATKSNQASMRAGVGVAYADSASALTMAHEIGHGHGRQHAPCALSGETITGVDAKYPYSKGVLGSWGWDSRSQTLFDPAKATDIMGYCNSQWMSDYTYAAITTRVAAVNGQPAAMVLALSDTLSKWRVLLLEARGPRWGVPIEREVAPEGEPETATIYDNTGAVLTSVVVYRTEISDGSSSLVWVPEPKPNWYAVAVAGALPHPFAAPVTVPRP